MYSSLQKICVPINYYFSNVHESLYLRMKITSYELQTKNIKTCRKGAGTYMYLLIENALLYIYINLEHETGILDLQTRNWHLR